MLGRLWWGWEWGWGLEVEVVEVVWVGLVVGGGEGDGEGWVLVVVVVVVGVVAEDAGSVDMDLVDDGGVRSGRGESSKWPKRTRWCYSYRLIRKGTLVQLQTRIAERHPN